MRTSGKVQRLSVMLPCCSCLQCGHRHASSGASYREEAQVGVGIQSPRQLPLHHWSSSGPGQTLTPAPICHHQLAEPSCSAEDRNSSSSWPSQASSPALPLPAPLWCTVGNTGIKCRSEAGGEALSAGGRSRSLECTPPLCSQTSCTRDKTLNQGSQPLTSSQGAVGHSQQLLSAHLGKS